MVELSILIAFSGGLASFIAPCVIPLVPAYVSYISGVSVSELKSENSAHYRNKILINSLFYIAGFSFIFVLLGLSATAISKTLIINRLLLLRLGGILIVFFGLYYLGVFNKFRFSQREFRITIPDRVRHIKYLGPFLLGNTFAIAWTPCVGAIFGAILTLAATSEFIYQGALLLFAYSLGISLPFLIIALTIGHSQNLLKKITPHLHVVNIVGGVILTSIGIAMIMGKYDAFIGFVLGNLHVF